MRRERKEEEREGKRTPGNEGWGRERAQRLGVREEEDTEETGEEDGRAQEDREAHPVLRESWLGQLLQCCCQLLWGFERPMSRLPPVLQQYILGDSLARITKGTRESRSRTFSRSGEAF